MKGHFSTGQSSQRAVAPMEEEEEEEDALYIFYLAFQNHTFLSRKQLKPKMSIPYSSMSYGARLLMM